MFYDLKQWKTTFFHDINCSSWRSEHCLIISCRTFPNSKENNVRNKSKRIQTHVKVTWRKQLKYKPE